MEKFHSFLAYTVVTIGLVKGRTVLPLPPSDVTSSEKTSSKDKSLILESKFNFIINQGIIIWVLSFNGASKLRTYSSRILRQLSRVATTLALWKS